jgi:hypothetical protein
MAGPVKRRLSFALALGASSVLAVLPLGCSSQVCDPSMLHCGNDGQLHCGAVPADLTELPRECCAASEPAPADAGLQAIDAGSDAGEQAQADSGTGPVEEADAGDDAGAPAEADAGSGLKVDVDAGSSAAGETDAGSLAANAGESCGDAAVPAPPDGGWPTGTDDAGLSFIYRCGVDVCHPWSAVSADAGADAGNSPFQCGPLGCN